MKLWILEPLRPWTPWYDKAFGFVVRAEFEQHARELAAKQCGDEGFEVWLLDGETSCRELTAEGDAAVILRDFAAA